MPSTLLLEQYESCYQTYAQLLDALQESFTMPTAFFQYLP